MAADNELDFDPYRKWLGIPNKHRPPTHYQLLGIADGESDAEVIEEAAIRQTTHVRAYQSGSHRDVCSRILKEIANARLTLMDPQRREDYNRKIGLGAASVSAQPLPPVRDFDDLGDDEPQVGRKPVKTKSIKKETNNRGVLIGLSVGGGVAALVIAGLLGWLLMRGAPAPRPVAVAVAQKDRIDVKVDDGPGVPPNPPIAIDDPKLVGLSPEEAAKAPAVKPLLGAWTDGRILVSYEINNGKLEAFSREVATGSSTRGEQFKIVGNKLQLLCRTAQPNPAGWIPISHNEIEFFGNFLEMRHGPQPDLLGGRFVLFRFGSPRMPWADPNSPAVSPYLGQWSHNAAHMTIIEAVDGKVRVRRVSEGKAYTAAEVMLIAGRLLYRFDSPGGNQAAWWCVSHLQNGTLMESTGPSLADMGIVRPHLRSGAANPGGNNVAKRSPLLEALQPMLGIWADRSQILSLQEVDGRFDAVLIDRRTGTQAKNGSFGLSGGTLLRIEFLPQASNAAGWPRPLRLELARNGANLGGNEKTDDKDIVRTFYTLDSPDLKDGLDVNSPFVQQFLGHWETPFSRQVISVANGKRGFTTGI